MELNFIFSIAILIMSVVIHEVAHGYTAVFLGDVTPKLQKRLTLNPLRHLDPVGSVLVPILTYFIGTTFGWAKPVMINPYNLRSQKWGELMVAFAGPLSNILVAGLFSIALRFVMGQGSLLVEQNPFLSSFVSISVFVIGINLTLAVFNLVPIPPLDGSKILFALIPQRFMRVRVLLEQYSLVFALVVIFVLWRYIEPIIPKLFSLFTGVGL